ncbi:hypothetical protein V4R08_05755 [Nitrobacter sp. NHB1]|uniref:hypothetical protein n=1 Tax=Nitrobacter sp. NHB1 TaxID=3119830 RepID=UPI002FFDDD79
MPFPVVQEGCCSVHAAGGFGVIGARLCAVNVKFTMSLKTLVTCVSHARRFRAASGKMSPACGGQPLGPGFDDNLCVYAGFVAVIAKIDSNGRIEVLGGTIRHDAG